MSLVLLPKVYNLSHTGNCKIKRTKIIISFVMSYVVLCVLSKEHLNQILKITKNKKTNDIIAH